ncbi:flagellar hook-basal body complex protein [Chromobacterium subtsugae]|uniref:Flagellar hook protein FlgE n=1 Tax=Chromobacterium subtsugae TaxID=251747 RepID=A0ABS7FBD2_9NEIS|nr:MULTISPECIES: flagellar hook-basal body complex protein [Chromobacterium]KUM01670.1 flagellar biosynthesis protein FlgE [Chromobacterium subtsugae]KZE84543.1 flagellar biosynthesis protein FlgE [Chromobacterium sp. F49]MBW7566236.1 flagellar hook-basal body complex protein [Chromobacterium subtsugae]MBW8287357.1 flagellar hook-basal body complex protein [Chromobacterium subtsugae]OBU87496.1 flagellar hook protein FlgE [Chromobacterium subtsugae]
MSFEIALSGINAVNNQLGSISDNISNSGTYGFKSGRVTFASAYAGSQAMGVNANPNNQNIGRSGGVVTTGRALDAAIDGRGFFVSKSVAGAMAYSRVGIFNTDKDGYLVDNYGGRVQGYAKSDTGALGAMGDIQIPTGNIPAKPSDSLQYTGNMSAGWAVQTVPFDKTVSQSFNHSNVSTVYDSLGNKHNLTQYFCKSADSTVTVHYALDGNLLGTTTDLKFDTNGKLTAPTAAVNLGLGSPAGASALNVAVDYTGTTQFAGEPSTSRNATNGYAPGARTGVSLGENGEVIVSYSNDQKMTVAQLAIANFANENALTAGSQTSWQESAGSGAALYSVAGSSMAGKLATGSLEQSNVDVTAELVSLMTAQRNYQANTKVISAENQAMQALMQAV